MQKKAKTFPGLRNNRELYFSLGLILARYCRNQTRQPRINAKQRE